MGKIVYPKEGVVGLFVYHVKRRGRWSMRTQGNVDYPWNRPVAAVEAMLMPCWLLVHWLNTSVDTGSWPMSFEVSWYTDAFLPLEQFSFLPWDPLLFLSRKGRGNDLRTLQITRIWVTYSITIVVVFDRERAVSALSAILWEFLSLISLLRRGVYSAFFAYLFHLLTPLSSSRPSSSLRIYRIPYRRHIGYSLQPDHQLFPYYKPRLFSSSPVLHPKWR
jgi:hypothetical protein